MPDSDQHTTSPLVCGTTIAGVSLMELGLSGLVRAQSSDTTASTQSRQRA